jgi:hypothetical protein
MHLLPTNPESNPDILVELVYLVINPPDPYFVAHVMAVTMVLTLLMFHPTCVAYAHLDYTASKGCPWPIGIMMCVSISRHQGRLRSLVLHIVIIQKKEKGANLVAGFLYPNQTKSTS